MNSPSIGSRLRRKLRGLIAPETKILLSPTSVAVRQENLTYLSDEKLRRLELAIERTRPIAGDVVEFGVALGGSAIILAKGTGKRFIGLDVFATIPPPTSEKDDDHSRERYRIIESGQSHGIGGDPYYGYRPDLYADVTAAFQRHGLAVDGDRIVLVKGLFEESWPKLRIDGIALAHIDCDWYDPVQFCLDAVAGLLSLGGIVIIDDYHDYGGCKTAVDEFLARRDDFTMEAGANPFLVKRN